MKNLGFRNILAVQWVVEWQSGSSDDFIEQLINLPPTLPYHLTHSHFTLPSHSLTLYLTISLTHTLPYHLTHNHSLTLSLSNSLSLTYWQSHTFNPKCAGTFYSGV